jgi:hypothetical protein
LSQALRKDKNKPSHNGKKRTGKSNFRSRVTSGLTILPTIDGRSTYARIMRDTLFSMISHAGGHDHISEPRRLLARRAAALEAELIHLETEFAKQHADGGSPSAKQLDIYQRMTGAQRRVFEALGLDPNMRDVTPPDPLAYAASYRREAEEAEEVDA